MPGSLLTGRHRAHFPQVSSIKLSRIPQSLNLNYSLPKILQLTSPSVNGCHLTGKKKKNQSWKLLLACLGGQLRAAVNQDD